MKLPSISCTPLTKKLFACICGLLLVFAFFTLWATWSPGHSVWAEAAEINLPQFDSPHPPFVVPQHQDFLYDEVDINDRQEQVEYESEFLGFPRSIIGRAASGVDSLTNNVKTPMDLIPGSTHNFQFSKDQVNSGKSNASGLPSPLDQRDLNARSDDGLVLLEEQRAEQDTFSSPREGSEPTGTSEVSEESRRQGVFDRKRQSGNQVYISVNTCQQPSSNGTTSALAPQLTLYISTSGSNEKPGPDSTSDLVTDPIPFDDGYVNYTLTTDSDVNIGIYAPPLPPNYGGNYHFEVAASIDSPYHSYNGSTSFLYLVDTDSTGALFVTHNLTSENTSQAINQQWMDMDSPFALYAFNDSNPAVKGLQKSFCGLQQQFDAANVQMDSSMTTWGAGDRPKQEFFVHGLNASADYQAFLVMKGNGTTDGLNVEGNAVVGGGGSVWAPMTFKTKTDMNCQVLYNLSFCSNVAYAVPSNPSWNATGLANLYDNLAKDYYGNFSLSLAQIACNTTSTAQYSLAKNCTDCANDYKNWLCSVLIPRCEDYSSNAIYLQPRNINANFLNGTVTANKTDSFAYNQSRNGLIDEVIKPGPYKEVLPCDDLCYAIVRSCSAALGFSCPTPGTRPFPFSYGQASDDTSIIQCNYPGVYFNQVVSGSSKVLANVGAACLIMILSLFFG